MLRDKLVGKMVVVVSGQFKGHRGRVTYADDRSAKVELSSQCKVIPIEKTMVQEIVNPQSQRGDRGANGEGRSVYGG